MPTEINRISQLLQATFNGEPWHGSSVMHTLAGITATQAAARPLTHIHSIWELVLHMTAWRTFAREKLRGNAAYDITGTEQDWPPVVRTDAQAWQQALLNLEQSQQHLLDVLNQCGDELLDKQVPGRKYTCYVLLQGIIHHDLYHAGQIALLKKQLM
jgi:uncharacterized damage-inducible protein DinB